jgi:hypothetical protein
MSNKLRVPFSVRACWWMINAASLLLPAAERQTLRLKWRSEIWHGWQYLSHLGLWNRGEACVLFRNSCRGFVDALLIFIDRYSLRSRARSWIRSPWVCVSALAVALLFLTFLTRGFPASRAIFTAQSTAHRNLVFIWFHPLSGAGDEGLPADAVAAWAKHSRLLDGIAPFVVDHRSLWRSEGAHFQLLVVRTVPMLFRVLKVTPSLGHIPIDNAVLLTNTLWRTAFRSDPRILGTKIRIGRSSYSVMGVLPSDFDFLSRAPAAYLVKATPPDGQQMVAARLRPGVSRKALDRELTRIAESECYYIFRSQLRYSMLSDAPWTPVRMFTVAVVCAAILLAPLGGLSLRRLKQFLQSSEKRPALHRTGFFAVKTGLGLMLVFAAGLEWSRSQNAILFGSRDPAASPILLWLYMIGSMGVLFWAIADQRARCRVCLRLLCFPVRVGCPGSLLLNWSGTELLCPEGHGIMHVPDLAPSWEETSERWISLDESWKDLFDRAR